VTEAASAAAIRRRIRIPLRFADGYATTATVISFTGLADTQQHVALELGRPAAARLPLVRLHSECLTGDVYGSRTGTLTPAPVRYNSAPRANDRHPRVSAACHGR
jgi:GTP cyclohydrolase II